MNDLKWYFPTSGPECLDLFNDGIQPHGGGTFLIKTALNTEGLFDTSRVTDFKTTEFSNNEIKIGSALSYSDVSTFLEGILPDNFISAALSSAASTPLRNRITLGGSLASAPKWSDLAGPLAAADAVILFEGRSEGTAYIEYLSDRTIRKKNLVSSVIVPEKNLSGRYYRFTLTGFDYPFFTVSVSIRAGNKTVCAVSGTAKGLAIFNGTPESILAEAAETLSFNDERGMTGEYIKSRSLVELKRMLSDGGVSNE